MSTPVAAVEGEQPRAVGAGKRGLGQPARRNASAATVQPEAAGAV